MVAEAAQPTRQMLGVPTLTRTPVGRQVRVPKTAELVARALRRQIIRRELGQGEALPSESALMEQFGVSRPTLREAFRLLESESLIEVRRGVRGGARRAAAERDRPAAGAEPRRGHRAHTKLVELIEAGKADEAEKLWYRHITATNDHINSNGTTILDLLD